MNEILINNPEAKDYALLIKDLLWSACAPLYISIMAGWAITKIIRAVTKEL